MSVIGSESQHVAIVTFGLPDGDRLRYEAAVREATGHARSTRLRLEPVWTRSWNELLRTAEDSDSIGDRLTGCYVIDATRDTVGSVNKNLSDLWSRDAGVPVLLLCQSATGQSVVQAHPNTACVVPVEPPLPLESMIPLVASLAAKRTLERENRVQSQRLIAAERLANLGPIAAGIAHDFNNLLTAIMSFGDLARESIDPSELAYEDLGEVLKAAHCAAGLTQQLQSFAKAKSAADNFQAFDLNTLLKERASLIESMLGETIRLEIHHSRNPAVVFGDETQIEQLVVDVVAHQSKAAGTRGGALAIQTFRSPQTTTLRLELSSPRLLPLPEPFESHQASQEILRHHGGALKTQRVEDDSLCVMLEFPTRAPDETIDSNEPESGPEPEVRRVLVVDDKQEIRDLCRRILGEEGYTTSLASSSTEALEWLRTNSVDILVTDLVMPGLSGLDLYDMIRVFNPSLGVIFMSGYPVGLLGDAPTDEKYQVFLQKPFVPARLLEAVRSVSRNIE